MFNGAYGNTQNYLKSVQNYCRKKRDKFPNDFHPSQMTLKYLKFKIIPNNRFWCGIDYVLRRIHGMFLDKNNHVLSCYHIEISNVNKTINEIK